MKLLLAVLLYLLTYLPAYAQAWPRNPTTGKVEFTGVLPWPANAKTEAQRRALVRRWYLAKLTDESAAAVEEAARTVVSPTLLTYAGLPIAVAMRSRSQPDHVNLTCIVKLDAAAGGLRFLLTEFYFSRPTDTQLGPSIEQVLSTDSPVDRPALAALRKRLTSALASW